MDLKLKGKAWVGNIYQKFETVCQEVDDFVSKDTVKYVENQVQTVGQSVKKFCSDVVQDLLPSPLVDSVKYDDETVPQKAKDDSLTKSMINREEKHVDIDTKQSSIEHDPIDPLGNCYTSPITGLDPVKQIMSMPTEVLSKLTDSVLPLGQDDDALVYDNVDASLEGNYSSEVEGIAKKEKFVSEDFSSPENKSEISLLCKPIDEYHSNEILGQIKSANLVDSATISSWKDRPTCHSSFDDCNSNNLSNTQSSELAFSFVSFGSGVAEMTLVSSSSSMSTESYDLSECSDAISQEKENICYNHTGAFTCVSDTLGALSSSVSCPNPVSENNGDVQFAFSNSVLSFESTDPSMETIDLSDRGKLDESCIVTDNKLDNNKLLFAVSCRARRHRSYKKIIQDAFASRKRLTKEYEQLGILYGDIDMESVQQPKQNMSLSITDMSLETKHSSNKDLYDSEWELL